MIVCYLPLDARSMQKLSAATLGEAYAQLWASFDYNDDDDTYIIVIIYRG